MQRASQRVSSDLRLNPHIHSIVLDGVFVPDGGTPVFHPLPPLDTSDLADVLQVIRVRIIKFLERKGVMVLRPLLGVVESRHELTLLDDAEEWWSFDHSSASSKDHDGFAEREPALAQLAAAAVTGLAPAGPEMRSRQPIALRGQPGVEVTASLSVTEMGFSLHAATTASADDSQGREALVRYALRPPIAQERLHILPDNLVRIELKRPFRDGTATPRSGRRTIAIDLDPLSLLCRLAASVPPPGFHLVHYAGVLGAASKLRALVMPPPPPKVDTDATHSHREQPPTHRSR